MRKIREILEIILWILVIIGSIIAIFAIFIGTKMLYAWIAEQLGIPYFWSI